MALNTISDQHTDLESVRAQFEQWRQSRKKRGAIPESLWKAAASLHPAYTLHRISKTLRLNHTQLKHIVKKPSDPSQTAAEHFIDLGIAAPICQFSVEMHRSDGNRMYVKDLNRQDLMNLASMFWSRP